MSHETFTQAQLLQAESDYTDGKFRKHPESAKIVAAAAREEAAKLGNSGGDLRTINRFTKLAEHLERASHSA